MGTNFSSINGLICFTANMPIAVPGDQRNFSVWIPAYRAPPVDAIKNVQDRLNRAWIRQDEILRGHPIPAYRTGDVNVLDDMTFQRNRRG